MNRRRVVLAFIILGLGGGGTIAACATSGKVLEIDASVDDASVVDTGSPAEGGKTDAGCNSGETKCGSVCKNLQTDPQNCGSCGSPCTGGKGCEKGECHVACGAQTRCLVGDSGPDTGVETCVDTKTNVAHCGGCNAACSGSEYCDAGACDLDCADAGTKCLVADAGLACVDTKTSVAHCGGCNQPCTGGKSCVNGACSTVAPVQIFPPSGTLQDPGASSVWSARYYTMTFAQQQTLVGLDWRANLSSVDSIRAQVWDPSTMAKVATGTTVNGGNVQGLYHSNINFTLLAGKAYLIGVFISNANTVFPRKDSPGYPFNVTGPFGNISVTACWSTSTTNTDIFPTSTNSWGPDFRLYLQ